MKLWRSTVEVLRAPPRERVLVLAPHPDDEVLGCGGTILKHLAQGDPVHVVVAFDGRAGLPANAAEGTRRQEAAAAAQILGLLPYHFLDHPEGHVPSAAQFEAGVRQLVELFASVGPEIVYAPWPGEAHVDHRTLARAAFRAAALHGGKTDVWGYEVWTPLRADRVIEISDVWETKVAALEAYASQLGASNLLLLAEERARARSSLFQERIRRSEGFLRFPKAEK